MSRRIEAKAGSVFNWLTAIEKAEDHPKTKLTRWKFLCKCGTEKVCVLTEVFQNKVKSCGCLKIEKKNLVGLKFGRLLVISYSHRKDNKHHHWRCVCDCGKEVVVDSSNLGKNTKSCGCLNRELSSIRESNPNNSDTQRQCYNCKEVKPLNNSTFGKNKSDKYGRNNICRECRSSGIKRIQNLIASYKRYDTVKKLTSSISLDFVFNLLKANTRCYSCGIKQDSNLAILGLDRIDNSKGHIEGNVLPCCTLCNRTRLSNFTVDEMKAYIGPAIKKINKARNINKYKEK